MMTILIVSSIIFLVSTSSPMTFSLILSLVSIMMSMSIYSLSHSVFISASLVVSFSSGLMILFTYCALVTNYKEKSKSSFNTLITLTLTFLLAFMMMPTSKMMNQIPPMVNITQQKTPLILIMLFVMLTMIFLNQSFFSLSKKLMKTY